MGVPGNANALLLRSAAAAGGYTIPRSLRFNSSDSAYLSRTPASAGNRKTWTFSCWAKRSKLSGSQFGLLGGGGYFHFSFLTGGALNVNDSSGFNIDTSALFRDPSAWYHIVLAVDTTQATSANRLKIYVNGTSQTLSGSYAAQNADTDVNAAAAHTVGALIYGGSMNSPFDGYLADIHFIDGQALTPSSFGETDATTGAWNPKAYSGSYGTNGFHLDFADNSAATAAALGKDTSGLGNNWTPNNLSVTAGAGNDSLVDSPSSPAGQTDSGAGGTVVGNYCTWNPLDISSSSYIALRNGNLDAAGLLSGSSWGTARSTTAVSSGKWYAEITISTLGDGVIPGITAVSSDISGANKQPGNFTDSYGYYFSNGNILGPSNADTAYGASFTTGDVIGIALNLDAGTLVFYKNGISQGTAASGLTKTYAVSIGMLGTTSIAAANFGQRPFAYTAPSGFKALCTANLPTPTIAKGSDYFDVKLYTGNGSTQTISGLNFSPDWVWIKTRSIGYFNVLYDTVRGTGTDKALYSNTTGAEGNDTTLQNLTAFNSDGFSLGTTSGTNILNDSSNTRVAWCWDAGANSSKTYTVTVVSGAFYIDGKQQPTLNLEEGSTYTFDLSAASNSGHPFRLSESANGPTQYTTGVTTSGTAGNAGATLTIAVASGAPTLYYFCTNHSGMGGQINTNTTAGASNFAGSITSTVRANASAGFSIVTYTGNGTSGATIGHGLGVAPSFVVVKRRNVADSWIVYHSATGNTKYLLLNNTTAATTYSGTWNNAGPSSTTITLGNDVGVNDNGGTYVCYAFSPVSGYSSFGSYTGNGSTDGPFVYTGFRPRWIMAKRTDTTGNWWILDTARDPYNVSDKRLAANLAQQEFYGDTASGLPIIFWDVLSNGFKAKSAGGEWVNASNGTYIYAAFAESPFAYARAR